MERGGRVAGGGHTELDGVESRDVAAEGLQCEDGNFVSYISAGGCQTRDTPLCLSARLAHMGRL